MKVTALNIYPIKGLKGISVTESVTALEGFTFDRRWMLIDDQGTFLSQRKHPRFALFQQSLDGQILNIQYEGNSLDIPTTLIAGQEDISVKVFDDEMLAREVSKKISHWFSKLLGKSVRLVRHGSATNRIKHLKNPEVDQKSTVMSFADGYPYLILGTASLEELNRRLESPVLMDRFRPNIVIETSEPHEEDDWKKIKIGQQEFAIIKPCARCEVTTVDQQSAQRGKEPLKTLAAYRRVGNKVNFGANAISMGTGVVKVGDEVEIG